MPKNYVYSNEREMVAALAEIVQALNAKQKSPLTTLRVNGIDDTAHLEKCLQWLAWPQPSVKILSVKEPSLSHVIIRDKHFSRTLHCVSSSVYLVLRKLNPLTSARRVPVPLHVTEQVLEASAGLVHDLKCLDGTGMHWKSVYGRMVQLAAYAAFDIDVNWDTFRFRVYGCVVCLSDCTDSARVCGNVDTPAHVICCSCLATLRSRHLGPVPCPACRLVAPFREPGPDTLVAEDETVSDDDDSYWRAANRLLVGWHQLAREHSRDRLLLVPRTISSTIRDSVYSRHAFCVRNFVPRAMMHAICSVLVVHAIGDS